MSRLTGGQKSWITKQARKYEDVVKKPDHYITRRVSEKTASQLKQAGYFVNRDLKALIYAKNQTVKVTRGRVDFINPDGIRARVILQSRPDFLEAIERLKKRERAFGPVPGRQYALKIGNSPRFHVTHPSFKDLLAYARALDQKGFHSPDARDHISLVIIDVEGFEYGQDLDDEDDEEE